MVGVLEVVEVQQQLAALAAPPQVVEHPLPGLGVGAAAPARGGDGRGGVDAEGLGEPRHERLVAVGAPQRDGHAVLPGTRPAADHLPAHGRLADARRAAHAHHA